MHNYRQKKLKFPWAAFYKTIFCHIDKSNVHWSTIKSHEIIYVISYFYFILSISNNFNNYKNILLALCWNCWWKISTH